MDTLAKRLVEAMELNDIRQSDLVEKTGINKGAISSYISGRYEPKQRNIYRLSKVLNVSEAWLMGLDVPMRRLEGEPYKQKEIKAVRIPVLGRVQAGLPIEAHEEILDYEEIEPSMALNGDYFGLQVRGDSMMPRFVEGDVVIVRQQSDAECGDIVIALVNGDEVTIKKLIKYDDKGIALVPLNPTYQPMRFSEEEIANKPVNIIGRVVELRGKF